MFWGVTSGGCRAHDAAEGCSYAAIQGLVRDRPDLFDVAIYEQAGIYLLSSPTYPDGNRRMIAGLGLHEAVPDIASNLAHVDRVGSYLRDLSDHIPVVWFGPRPEPHIPLETVLRTGCKAAPLRPGLAQRFEALDGVIAARLPAPVRFLSQRALYDIVLPRDFGNCDGILWRDGDHLSVLGQKVFGRRADVVRAARDLVAGSPAAP